MCRARPFIKQKRCKYPGCNKNLCGFNVSGLCSYHYRKRWKQQEKKKQEDFILEQDREKHFEKKEKK